MTRRALGLSLTLSLAASVVVTTRQAQPVRKPIPIAIRVDSPARVGFPIWVHADLQGPLVARYPFQSDLRYFGSNTLELRRNGEHLPAQTGFSLGGPGGLVHGSSAPPSSPQNRLPLHLRFAIDRPGRYAVRWTVAGPIYPFDLLAQSDWLEFEVLEAQPREREAWLTKLLAAPPQDEGAYVGDYLPFLLVALPDPPVVRTIVAGTYSRSLAGGSLDLLPAEVAVPLVVETLRERGPNVGLARFVSLRVNWFQDHREDIVRSGISFLRSTDDPIAQGALSMLGYASQFDWRDDAAALRKAERAVDDSAPSLMGRGGEVSRQLAVYLGGSKSAAARDRLWELVERQPAARRQALIALTWIADPRDLSTIAGLLMKPACPIT